MGRTLRTPIHKDRAAGRRVSALRAETSLRRRKAARRRQDDRSRHVAEVAEKFRTQLAVPMAGSAADVISVPDLTVTPRMPITPPSLHYIVLYFVLAVTSVLAAAHTHIGGQRAHPSLIALTQQTIPRAVIEPQRTALRELPVQDVATLPAADPPPAAGLAALRETIQSRQLDQGFRVGSRTTGPGSAEAEEPFDETLIPERPDASGSLSSAAVFDDEFGAGLKAPGICELADVAHIGTDNRQGQVAQNQVSEMQVAERPVTDAPVSEAPVPLTRDETRSVPLRQVLPADFGMALAAAAQRQTSEFTVYTDKYRHLSYPMGDVPALFGVCTDVVIRAYRALGVDLQALIHIARIGPADTSIAHRRTFTLRRYFASRGASMPISEFSEDYVPGDIVTYYRPQNRGSRDHIAIVSNQIAPSGRPMIVHNRGWGPQVEDALFVDKITGHYRYRGRGSNSPFGPSASSGKPAIPSHTPRAAEVKPRPKARGGKVEAPSLRR